tara:strand:+ start:1065 stop:1961 length:897 start_codon:yes stop_codon:yes gene_type:complete
MISSRTVGYIALAGAIIGYGGLWPVTHRAIELMPPFWFASMRMCTGVVILAAILLLVGRFKIPRRQDIPIIVSVGFLMMAFYTTLMHVALEYVEAGRAAFLGYTTPLWVLPLAYLVFGEIPSKRRLLGVFTAIIGLIILFKPSSFDWSDKTVVIGNSLLLLCAVLWSITIIHIRAYRSTLTPIQLAPFQLSIAASFIFILALIFDPIPEFKWSIEEISLFAYGATFGTALAMMSVTTCIHYLPTIVSTVGLLGAPVFALLLSVTFQGEILTLDLAAGVLFILGGIVLVSLPEVKAENG